MLSVYQFLLTPLFIGCYCAGIVFFFAWALRRLLSATNSLTKNLEGLRDALPRRDRPDLLDKTQTGSRPLDLSGALSSHETGTSPEEVRKRFAEQFESYDRRASAALHLPWDEFVERLILPEPGSGQPIRNTSDVAGDLNDQTIVFPQVHARLFHSIPNMLTGFGILGTFLGLVAGVGVASAGLTSADQARVTTALGELLDGASLAFLTSVVGILLSMVFLLFERHRLRTCHEALHDWVMALEDCLLRVTTEDLAQQTLVQATITANQLKTFNTDLIMAIEEALEATVTGPLVKGMERLLESLEHLRRDRATESEAVIQAAMAQFVDTLNTQTSQAFGDLAATVARLDETLRTSVTDFHEAAGRVHNATEASLGAIKKSQAEGATAMRDSMQEAHGAFREFVTEVSREYAAVLTQAGAASVQGIAEATAGLERAARATEASTRQSREVLGKLEGAASAFGALREAIRTTHERIAASAESVRAAAADLSDAGAGVAASLARTSGLVERVEASVATMRRQEQALTAAWRRYQERFEGIDASLESVFRQMSEALAAYCTQVKDFANELDRRTAESVKSLASAAAQLNDSVEELADVMLRKA